MNKRIKELAEQQGLTGPNYLISSQELEKFADALIQECIVAVKQTNTHHALTTYDQNLIQATISKSVEAIRNHFE